MFETASSVLGHKVVFINAKYIASNCLNRVL